MEGEMQPSESAQDCGAPASPTKQRIAKENIGAGSDERRVGRLEPLLSLLRLPTVNHPTMKIPIQNEPITYEYTQNKQANWRRRKMAKISRSPLVKVSNIPPRMD